MTTIAYDGKTIAIDSQVTLSGMVVEYANKIEFINTSKTMIAAGSVDDIIAAKRWFADESKEKPDLENIVGLLVVGDQVFMFAERLYTEDITGRPQAAGSGWQLALAAMDLGKDAQGAVEYAATRDIHTGGEIQTFTVGGSNGEG